jgi:hypothetical protein
MPAQGAEILIEMRMSRNNVVETGVVRRSERGSDQERTGKHAAKRWAPLKALLDAELGL